MLKHLIYSISAGGNVKTHNLIKTTSNKARREQIRPFLDIYIMEQLNALYGLIFDVLAHA